MVVLLIILVQLSVSTLGATYIKAIQYDNDQCAGAPIHIAYIRTDTCFLDTLGDQFGFPGVHGKWYLDDGPAPAVGEPARELTSFRDERFLDNGCTFSVNDESIALDAGHCIIDLDPDRFLVDGSTIYTQFETISFIGRPPVSDYIAALPIHALVAIGYDPLAPCREGVCSCGAPLAFIVSRACNGIAGHRYRCGQQGLWWFEGCEIGCQNCNATVASGFTPYSETTCYANDFPLFQDDSFALLSCSSCTRFPEPCGPMLVDTVTQGNVTFDHTGFSVVEGATMTCDDVVELGGPLNISFTTQPPRDTPVVVQVLRAAQINGQFDTINVEVPEQLTSCEQLDYGPTPAAPSATVYSVSVTLRSNVCPAQDSLSTGTIVGIACGAIALAAAVIISGVALQKYKVRRRTTLKNAEIKDRDIQELKQHYNMDNKSYDV